MDCELSGEWYERNSTRKVWTLFIKYDIVCKIRKMLRGLCGYIASEMKLLRKVNTHVRVLSIKEINTTTINSRVLPAPHIYFDNFGPGV